MKFARCLLQVQAFIAAIVSDVHGPVPWGFFAAAQHRQQYGAILTSPVILLRSKSGATLRAPPIAFIAHDQRQRQASCRRGRDLGRPRARQDPAREPFRLPASGDFIQAWR
jgi:hypothetical protein